MLTCGGAFDRVVSPLLLGAVVCVVCLCPRRDDEFPRRSADDRPLVRRSPNLRRDEDSSETAVIIASRQSQMSCCV